jgi:hypothetical protein
VLCTPLRLLDCLGFVTPADVFEATEDCFAVVSLRFGGVGLVGGGSLADWANGEDRKTEGDGIVIVSILSQLCVETLRPATQARSQSERCFNSNRVGGFMLLREDS